MSTTIVEVAPRGTDAAYSLAGELIVPRLVARRRRRVEVALVAGRAMLLPGDHVHLDIRVGEGCTLDLVDIGGLVVYGRPDLGDEPSGWHAAITLAPGARLTWEGLPTVVTADGELLRSTVLRLSSGSSVALRETLVLGRTGESGGRLSSDLDATDAAGPLLRETLEVQGDRPEPGVLGRARVMDSIVVLGERLGPVDETGIARLDLAGEGTTLRHLGDAAHHSPLGELWRAAVASRRDEEVLACAG
ncbi:MULTISPECIES: urease accessory protein UreD [Microbacterium]|uniref:urease accessory protein UreD n=1 Tax=Microbacterium TaxID=33882 RepID=UPI0027887A7F|nr:MULTISPECIES: urease accessory protein UreD [Microbacterium]MDQ1082757.1 urease accessory protein [Microbacterium sp. SORGH_AS_0344]MDQ1168473.1 urease accessory protein [Microbacterium proteolyticum]